MSSADITLTPDRLRRIASELEVALELSEDERRVFLQTLREQDSDLEGRVGSLVIAQHSEATLADEAALNLSQEALELGSRVGPYQVVEHLGTGGMGSVYLCQRADDTYRRLVAIKVIRRGFEVPETRRRFTAERQILASFDHPNIARMFEGGTTESGQPYLVMEYIKGVRIDHYCEQRSQSVEQCLELFLKVCSAVSYAHRHLVIHRDLKTSNVLVTKNGQVKLLDFGVAKLLLPDLLNLSTEATQTGLSPMTPHYASPEQLRGESINTISDVYSLGALFYKILTGELPLETSGLSFIEWASAPDTQKILPPSKVIHEKIEAAEKGDSSRGPQGSRRRKIRRQLEGDIDTILLTALHRDVDRRYASAEALAGDIKAHLEGRPIAARGDKIGYLLSKFLSRHRLSLSLMTLAFMAISGLAILALHQARVANQERNIAQAATQRAEAAANVEQQVTRFMADMFGVADPDAAIGQSLTARQLLERQADRIRHQRDTEPIVRARFLEAVGEAFRNLGMYEKAASVQTEVLNIRRANLGSEHVQVARALLAAGSSRINLNEHPEAQEMLREALALLDRLEPQLEHPQALAETRASCHYELGRSLSRQQKHLEALAVFKPAVAAFESADSEHDFDPMIATRLMNGLAASFKALQRLDESRQVFDQARALGERELGANHPVMAHIYTNLGQLHVDLGESEKADDFFQAALAIYEEAGHSDTENLGIVYFSQGRSFLNRAKFDEAESYFRKASELYEAAGTRYAVQLINTLNALAALEVRRDRLEAAALGFKASLNALARLQSPNKGLEADLHNNLGVVREMQEKLDEAHPYFVTSIRLKEELFGPEHPRTLTTKSNLAHLEMKRGNFAASEEIYVQVVAAHQAIDPETLRTDGPYFGYGQLLIKLGRMDVAEDNFRRALKAQDRVFDNEHPDVQEIIRHLVRLLRAEGRVQEAAELESRLIELDSEEVE